jgi:hypothetical protein
MPPEVLQIIFEFQYQHNNIQRIKCGCLGTSLCNIWWFVFFKFLTPFTLKGHKFLNYISFLTIFSALDAPIGGVQVLFKHIKQWSPPLGFGLPWTLKYYSCNSIVTNGKLKKLTHMFCLQISCYKLYKRDFSFVLSH